MIGYNIKELMKEKGLTQKVLAEQAKISQSTLSAIINGTHPSPSTMKALSMALDIPVEELNKKTTQGINRCPRCNSSSIVEWFNHSNNHCRIHCAYCEADSGEQKSRAEAERVFGSFISEKAERGRAHESVYVLSLEELLDSSCADADDVRPAWFENRGLFIVPALIQYGSAERELELVKVLWYGKMHASSYLLNLYGESWRCWNRRPTAERSDAEAWVDA